MVKTLDQSQIQDSLILGEALEMLKLMPDKHFDCVVTSPPYWNQRDYNNPKQIGIERTSNEYLFRLDCIFQQVKRVLKPEGTCWINLGDVYNQNKSLMMLPEKFALDMLSNNWILRNEIIWHKPNPMPESVKDRCTKAHEKIYFFTKSKKYFYDADIIKTKSKNPIDNRSEDRKRVPTEQVNGMRSSGYYEYANKRDVWSIPVEPCSEAHFATFPEKLIEPCILAGCPENGIVLDPFFGYGTTGIVAKKHNRHFCGIELNYTYAKMATERFKGETNNND